MLLQQQRTYRPAAAEPGERDLGLRCLVSARDPYYIRYIYVLQHTGYVERITEAGKEDELECVCDRFY